MRRIDLVATVIRTLWYWHTLPVRASHFARRYAPEASFFVFGHIHRAGIWHLGGRTVINTGSYKFPSKPHIVVVDQTHLSVWPVRFNGRTYAWAARPRSRFRLPDAGIGRSTSHHLEKKAG